MSEELDYISPGDRAGPFRIVRAFKGHSGMARVFEAEIRRKYRRPDLPRHVALKIAKEDYQGALVAEADYLRRFDHPNVVHILPLPRGAHPRPVYAAREHFRFGWGWYYAMELVQGGSLERHLTRRTTVTDMLRPTPDDERPLSVLKALGTARQLTAALEHIHERHVVNLDIKPANVLFRHRRLRFLRGSVPRVVLCDFGIARDLRHTRAGLLGVATPAYVSPEQASELSMRPKPLDARSDIFSLGVLLYEMLTGTLPFDTIALVADPSYSPSPPRQLRPSIPPELERIVQRALNKQPSLRFQTAAEMRAALNRVANPFDWQATARRAFASATLVSCLVGTGGICNQCASPPPPPPPATPSASATATPVTATRTVEPTARGAPTATQKPTSTPAPTYTPTRTPSPVTATPTQAQDPGPGDS